MEQLALFAPAGQSRGLPSHLLDYRPAFLDQQESDALLELFIRSTPWKQSTQKLWDIYASQTP